MSLVQVTRSASLVQVTATRPQVAVGTPSVVTHNALTNRSDANQHPASAITFTPAGSIAATTVQTAIAELDTEKQPLDADLTAISALTTTAYGRGALTLADAPAFASYAGVPLLATAGITGTLTLSKTGTTARTVTFPDQAITVAGKERDTVWTALQTFTNGLTVSAGTTALQAVTCTTLMASGANHTLGAYTGQTVVEVRGLSTANNSPVIDLYRSGASIGTFGVQGGYLRLGVNAVGNHTDATLAGLALGVSDTTVQILGTTPGTAPAGQVLIGGGSIKAAGGITCASQVIGTDPGGSELLRVGGGIACTTLSVASANYIYMRGNATTDGSVRMSSSADHVVLFESRQSGVWTTIGQVSGV